MRRITDTTNAAGITIAPLIVNALTASCQAVQLERLEQE